MSNRSNGLSFEDEFCELLSNEGWWAHNLTQDNDGQPADVIAAKDYLAYLIDCKVCATSRFVLTRIETNQEMAMKSWMEAGNNECYFACKYKGNVYMLPASELFNFLYEGIKSVKVTDYPRLEDWLWNVG